MNRKGAANFETIAAIFGAILIGTGVAWFVAQNWHQIPSALKIAILLGATAASFAAGTILNVRGYASQSKALYVLGALLFTLSVFLIAQIFFTGGSMQGIAWLWVIAILGALAASYALESKEILGVAILESIVWVATQGYAFFEGCSGGRSFSPSLACYSLAIAFSITGLVAAVILASIIFKDTSRKFVIFGALAFSALALFSAGLTGILYLILIIPVAGFVRKSENKEEAISLFKGLLSSTLIFWATLLLIRPDTLQESAITVFLASAAAFALAYNLKSGGTLFLALVELLFGVVLQYAAFADGAEVAVGMLAVYLLELGVIFYGLSLLHRAKEHEFAKTYGWWTAFYFLIFTYLLSFQFTLPALWAIQTSEKAATILAYFLGLAAAMSLGIGLKESLEKASAQKKEIIGAIGIIIALLAIIIGSANLVSQEKGYCQLRYCSEYNNQNSCQNAPYEQNCAWDRDYCRTTGGPWDETRNAQSNLESKCQTYNNKQDGCLQQKTCKWIAASVLESIYSEQANVPLSLWGLWLFANIVFLAVSLGAIFYGTWQMLPGLVNLGIAFFALDILTRYVGFISDYWGSIGLSLIFITGGIVLIGGGVLVEKWRKKLVTQAKGITSA